MITLDKGGNAALEAQQLTVTVDVAAEADLSALLLTGGGRVRTEADFVFYNQPTGPGVRCSPPAGGAGWRVDVDLAALPADIEVVRLVTSLDDDGKVFGQVGQPLARVADAAGTTLVEFAMTGLDRESIVIALELYRRAGAWKVRAVGQGYDGGLAALLADHGVAAEEEPAVPAPPAASTPPPPPPPPPSSSTPVPPPPPARSTPPPPPPPPPRAAPAAPATPAGVNLTKGRPVNLTKGQSVNLVKDGNQALTLVRMGLGWDAVRKSGMFGSREVDVDLDATAVLFAGQEPADLAFYNNLRTRDGSVTHQGDNRTGAGDGDDEVVEIDLTRVPERVTTIVLIVTSYQGHTFEQVQNAFCRLVDAADGELARYALAGGMPFTGMAMAKLYRDAGIWKMQAIGSGIQAKTPIEAVPLLAPFL